MNILQNQAKNVKISIALKNENKYYITFTITIFINKPISPSIISKFLTFNFKYYKSTRKIIGDISIYKPNLSIIPNNSINKYINNVITNNNDVIYFSKKEFEEMKKGIKVLKQRIEMNEKSFIKAIGSKSYYYTIVKMMCIIESKSKVKGS